MGRWRKLYQIGTLKLHVFRNLTIILNYVHVKRQTKVQFRCRDIHDVHECLYTSVRHVGPWRCRTLRLSYDTRHAMRTQGN